MQLSGASQHWDSTTSSGPISFNVVIIYEDMETGLRAKQLFDCLERSARGDGGFTHHIWSSDVLCLPEWRATAARAAASADMVIVSVHGDGKPAAGLKAWMADLLEQPHVPGGALVAMFDGEVDSEIDRGFWQAVLGHIARETNRSFFAKYSGPRPESSIGTERDGTESGSAVAVSRFEENPGYVHYGINE